MFDFINADFLASFLAWTLGILAVLGTFYDFYTKKFKIPTKEVFKAFSVTANINNLLKINKSESVINCIDGIKAISAIWIALGHRRLMMNTQWGAWQPWQQFIMQIINNYGYCVVTFFACSGILISQSMLRSLNRGSFNIIKVYVNRLFRTYPVYALLVLYFLSSMLPTKAQFPEYKNVCMIEWRKALTLVQNYYFGNMCLGHTWYISTDFQLFLLSPFAVGLLHKFHKKGIVVLAVIIMFVQVRRFNELSVNPNMPWFWNYFETHYRLGEFFIGIITGYIMYNKEISEKIEKVMSLSRIIPLVGWLLSIGFFYFHMFKAPIYPFSPFFRMIYLSTERELWACSVCWIVFACHRLKSGGIIRSFLSHSAWQPLSKLTLSIYLLHIPYFMYTTEYYPTSFGFLWIFQIFLSDIFIAVLIAISAYVFVEAPVGKLVTLTLQKKSIRFETLNQEERIPLVKEISKESE